MYDWFKNHNGGNNKRDDASTYDGDVFHPDFKNFAADRGVAIPELSDYATYSASLPDYTVQDGDIGVDIAAKYGLTIDQLQEANPFVDWDNLPIGSTLNIPDANGSN